MLKLPWTFSLALTALAAGSVFAQETTEIEGDFEDVEGDFEDVEGELEEVEGELEEAPAEAGETPAPTAETPAPASEGAAPTTEAPTEPAEPAPAEPAPAEAVASPSSLDEKPVDTPPVDAGEPAANERRVGEAVPLTRREPLVRQFQFEADIHYGLVGTGPTRLTNDVRFGLFDWWELRTAFLPYPSSLMSRIKIGEQQGPFGALIIDGGLAHFDAGLRLVPDEGEAEVGLRFHFEAGVAYTRAIGDRFSIYTSARTRYRYSLLSKDDQTAVAADMQLTYDLLDNLAVSAGVGYAEVVGTKVRELAVDFVETGRPGLSHFLLRDDGWSRSVTIPLALTYARIETFDVDVFVTPRVWPQFDLAFGAGLRWRFDVVKDTKALIDDASRYVGQDG